MKGFFVDNSNFSGKDDLFQVLNGKSRRLTFEGEKRNEIDKTWNIKNFSGISHAHPDSILNSVPKEFRDRFSRVTDPGSTSPTYKPSGEPREWGDYGDDD
jgi:hypothetical protein